MRKWLLVIVLFFLVGGCNPKPQLEEDEVLVSDIINIEDAEKLTDTETVYQSANLLEGLERIYRYYGNEFPEEEQKKIKVYEDFEKVSYVDFMNLMAGQGIDTLLSFRDAENIELALKEDKPVYAKFTLINAEEWNVLFYGYSDEDFAYFNMESGEKKTIGKKRIEALGEFETIIPYEIGKLTESEKERSVLYVQQRMTDAYWADDPTALKKWLAIAEKNSWLDNVGYIYAYYYLFHDPQPERIAKNVEAELKKYREPYTLEIALKYYTLINDEEEVKRTIRDIQIMQGHRKETLQFIIDNGAAYGYLDKAAESAEMLKKKKQ